MGLSSFDRVNAFLQPRSAGTPVPAGVEADVDVLVRRCERVRSLGEAFAEVELSPYMRSLLGTHDEMPFAVEAERASAAAGS